MGEEVICQQTAWQVFAVFLSNIETETVSVSPVVGAMNPLGAIVV
jgi:hypothetical protein